MNAKEARELANKNLKGPIIKPYMADLYDRIERAANKGEFSIHNPFVFFGITDASAEAKREMSRVLQEQGYIITNRPDPDPGDIRGGGSYGTLSWK